MVLLLAAARARLPSRLEFQGSAESSTIERRRWRRRPCLLRHLAAAAAPNARRERESAGPSARALPRKRKRLQQVRLSALCGSRIFADVPRSHHDLGCLVLITQVVRNGSFAKVLRTRVATDLPAPTSADSTLSTRHWSWEGSTIQRGNGECDCETYSQMHTHLCATRTQKAVATRQRTGRDLRKKGKFFSSRNCCRYGH